MVYIRLRKSSRNDRTRDIQVFLVDERKERSVAVVFEQWRRLLGRKEEIISHNFLL